MAAKSKAHKIRARLKAGGALVKVLIRHPMETGNRRDPATGHKVPRHFIRELTCEQNGNQVMSAVWNWGVSPNPYLAFRLKQARQGDKIRIHWVDNRGITDSVETRVR